jgi:hypothetical protein
VVTTTTLCGVALQKIKDEPSNFLSFQSCPYHCKF